MASSNDTDKPWWGEANDCRKKSGLSCSFAIFAALNIGMMVIGIQNMEKCPVEPMIPIYLIVSGSTSLSLLLVRLVVSHVLVPLLEADGGGDNGGGGGSTRSIGILVDAAASAAEQHSAKANWVLSALRVYDSLASIFSTCWLIMGSVYVYGTHPENGDTKSPEYCDYTAFVFAFIVVTIGFVSLFLSIVAAVLHCCFRNKQ